MARSSCFAALLAGRWRKRAVASCNECPRVKPVELIDAQRPVTAAGVDKRGGDKVVPCGDEIVAGVVAVAARDEKGDDVATVERGDGLSDHDDDDFVFLPRQVSVGSVAHGSAEKGVTGAVPAAVAAAAEEADPLAKLKRSCSNIETKWPGPRDAPDMPARSRSCGDLAGGFFPDTAPRGAPETSPASVKTSCTADRVMLKKRSSSQVLPSRSRKLWWRLFLWSHRNLHRPWSARPSGAGSPGRRRGGYTSDTLEEGPAPSADRKNKKVMMDESPPPPPIPSQWVAFSAENSLDDRVTAWVNSIGDEPFRLTIAEEEEDDDNGGGEAARTRPLEAGEPSWKPHGSKPRRCTAADEVAQASSIIQSLNTVSSVAHIAGMGLKVVPMIVPFSSLRAVNLSGNFIVHISRGLLPKGLHSLDLSRNKIANVEGLRELTKLRVLNLSYNRIARIGHGLSSCTAMREMYLAGNKIGEVEGLHRLLKLAVLDLSFNRLTTAKALGQLVANYHSLLALNLVGNPVQANVGDDALRKAVTGLLPRLAYLNGQPVKPREAAAAADSVARAALGVGGGGGGGGGRNRRRRASRRLAQSSPGSSSALAAAAAGRSRSRGAGSGSGRDRA